MTGAAVNHLVEAIERATLAAVAPPAIEELGPWLLPFDAGSVRRAHSAVPLRHENLDPAAISLIEARYQSHGLVPAFRLADRPGLDALQQALAAMGYGADQPTLVMASTVSAMRAVAAQADASLQETPDPRWAAVYASEGFDPVDAAHRIQALSRARGALYVSLGSPLEADAVGVVSFSHGWASIHGMRTVASQRGRGLAARLLASMADAAQQRGVERVFLQVDRSNAGAQRLYQRAGFESLWTYRYWCRPGNV